MAIADGTEKPHVALSRMWPDADAGATFLDFASGQLPTLTLTLACDTEVCCGPPPVNPLSQKVCESEFYIDFDPEQNSVMRCLHRLSFDVLVWVTPAVVLALSQASNLSHGLAFTFFSLFAFS